MKDENRNTTEQEKEKMKKESTNLDILVQRKSKSFNETKNAMRNVTKSTTWYCF